MLFRSTSIPQDVFIASGATVKPSLLFFKKFTTAEEAEWKEIAQKAEMDIANKNKEQIKTIQEKLTDKTLTANDKKPWRAEQKQLEEKMAVEIKAQIKKEFDYVIPIAEVEKAGISTTGAEIENELKPLAEEFKAYASTKKLWKNKFETVSYDITSDNHIYRMVAGAPQEFYGR